ncbi:P-loop containing nucleoside triphosphate hydrolase protein [Artomyces pyxidatus]|uniref:P-loop containing nucleoside triphosphate hydrolase protein n=1 Tax=Artomyces pyxidatus TaxID=48021 RepID=A0ACB8SZ45_9AGAM|nr:P-loop containing nucleoside triphosphate hydrolase protein [Artomyces pyxidatus]
MSTPQASTRALPTTPPKGRRHKRYIPPTPRSHKAPSSTRLYGIHNLKDSPQDIKRKLTDKLNLTFEIDDWQAEMIHKIKSGYDSILVAGTGYGKSIVFEGLAALDKSKTVIVISPLKALERDQKAEAEKKGLRAEMVNEDTICADLWKKLRQCEHHLYYVSPEMALSDGFVNLWQSAAFRSRIQALIVDEAHCIEEWGDGFREQYAEIGKLRNYAGHEIPFVACTATCSTETFSVIWSSMGFGNRPFWGIDVGCDRPNLLFLTRILQNTKNPVLDALNILPTHIAEDAPATVLPKSLFYFDSIADCNLAVQTLRKCLPTKLRDCVQTFKSTSSEAGKKLTWEKFGDGRIRILCATDAAGMGCNVGDVEYVAMFNTPSSISVLVQRWGRAARNRTINGTCLLFVPKWALTLFPSDNVSHALGSQGLLSPSHIHRGEASCSQYWKSSSTSTLINSIPVVHTNSPQVISALTRTSPSSIIWIPRLHMS